MYSIQKKPWRNSLKRLNAKEIHLIHYFHAAKKRAKIKNLPFNITAKYLRLIATDICPIFGTQFDWGTSGLGRGKYKLNSPQLDRIIPELGYVEGNVSFISNKANRIKGEGTMIEHYAIADWIWNHTHVKENKPASVSTGSDQESRVDPKHGSFYGTRAWENSNCTYDYSRITQRKNADSGAQTSSGNSMGSGVSEMGTSETLKNSNRTWYTKGENSFLEQFIEHLCRESRELGMAVRAGEDVRLPNYRRELEIQGSINEAIQSTQKTFEKLQEALDPNWNSEPTGTARFVVSGRYTGLGAEAGDKSNPISGQVHGPGPEE